MSFRFYPAFIHERFLLEYDVDGDDTDRGVITQQNRNKTKVFAWFVIIDEMILTPRIAPLQAFHAYTRLGSPIISLNEQLLLESSTINPSPPKPSPPPFPRTTSYNTLPGFC
jgi:hypothetical protein